MSKKRKRGHGWSSDYRKRKSKQYRDVKVRFICPSLQPDGIKVRSVYEHSPGLHTTLHYPHRIEPRHESYTCKPRTVRVKSTYEYSPGLQTILHYPQEIVLKHFIHMEKQN